MMVTTEKAFLILLILLILPPYLVTAFAPPEAVAGWFNADDAFYYFKVAQSIVEGKGITFDGISRTNGFHPLWMILAIPFFTLASAIVLSC